MVASFLFQWVKDNIKREEGQAMAEYGIILALIAAVCITLLVLLGNQIVNALGKVTNAL
ncbi:MAG TPA: Flp family type IVb pilin [Gaiellaceae bacterium]|jgi:pilus assembly protein Flp/PilA